MTWYCKESGHGRPLVLLHGIGMSSNAWRPVQPLLARERRVLAFDVAGFGRTPPLPAGVTPNAANLVQALQQTLQAMGINEPVDFAGNSMGGYLAMEAAKQGLARSVVALSPGGLWQEKGSAHIRPVFGAMRATLRRFPRVGELLVQVPPLRTALMAVPLSSQAWKMPARDAVIAVRNFAGARAFEETFDAFAPFTGGDAIKVPLTVAFGTRDWLLTSASQHRGELPAHTRWLTPRGWGHVPMWDDPHAVARLILEGTR